MIQVSELIEWLQTLEPTSVVGIDDGGLTLVAVTPEGIDSESAYIEVGGLPEAEGQ